MGQAIATMINAAAASTAIVVITRPNIPGSAIEALIYLGQFNGQGEHRLDEREPAFLDFHASRVASKNSGANHAGQHWRVQNAERKPTDSPPSESHSEVSNGSRG
jgi:hypothetical protein